MRMLLLRDWRQALRTPHVYRVGNSTLRIQHQFYGVLLLILIVLVLMYVLPWIRGPVCSSASNNDDMGRVSFLDSHHHHNHRYDHNGQQQQQHVRYNSTYPISPPVKTAAGISYRIGIISDLDKSSKDTTLKDTWFSFLKKGRLFWMPRNNFISISWDQEETRLTSNLAMNGRGMELSELVTFNGHLLTFDDRTGIIYRLEGHEVFPWLIIMDGNGTKHTKGFKSEWACVRNQLLYVGSMGKEWTTSGGEFQHDNPMWVKVITTSGEIQSLDWIDKYKKLRQSIDIEFPGYMIHESGSWSDIHKSWFFLPRRCSQERYNETMDETMSCNVLLTADENFENIKVQKIDNTIPIRGFSSFKFLPGSHDLIIIALKTEEYRGQTATYITAFTINGQVLLPDERIMGLKFEGLEFI